MRIAFLLCFTTVLNSIVAQNINVTFNAKLTFPGQNLANIWGYADGGLEYALVGAEDGMVIVDVTDPGNPTEIVQIPGVSSHWREIKTYQHYAYIVSEGPGSKIQVVDLSDLPDPNLNYHAFTGGNYDNGHALHVDEITGYLYVYGANVNSGKAMVFNLNNDPYNPSYVGFVNHIGYVHDGFVENDMLYSAHVYNGKFAIIDMSNKSNPVLLGTQTTPGAFTHNTWKSGNILFTTDEVSNSFLTSYDVSDPTDITELDRLQITPGSNSIVHNTHIINDYAVTSWYKDGFAIIDVSRPSNMVQVGRYDTYPNGSGNGFEGCWGVYPYLPSGTIVASNIRELGTNDGELWVLTPNYVRGCYLEGQVTDANTGFPVNSTFVQILTTSTSGLSNNLGNYKLAQLEDGDYIARFSRLGYFTQDVSVTLSNGVLTNLNVALEPDVPLPVEWTHFDAKLDGKDALLNWKTASEINNAGFEIQHSTNSGQDWRALDFVPSQSNGTAATAYSFRVKELEPGEHFFRLRQIDRDGASSFSPIRSLKLYSDRLQADVFPNPVTGTAQLRIRAGQNANVQIEVFNINQQPVGIQLQAEVDAETLIPLELGDLPAGTYFVRVWSGQEQEQVVLIKK